MSQVLTELRRLGYEVFPEGDQIRCRLADQTAPDRRRALAALREVRTRHDEVLALLRAEVAEGWPAESAWYEGRFRHRAARLYPLLGQIVDSPQGRALLLHVGSATCVVAPRADPGRTVCVPCSAIRPARAGGSAR